MKSPKPATDNRFKWTLCIVAMSGINSGHHNLPTYEISLKSNDVEFAGYCGGHFENDVLTLPQSPWISVPVEIFRYQESIWDIIIYLHMKCRWNRTMLNLCGIVIWKWWPVEIFQYRDIIIYPHIQFWWYRTMLKFCGIVVAILKMATGRNFSMSGHHYLPTYPILMISDNVEFLPSIFYAVFWQPFWKWQTSWKFWKHRIAPLLIKFYVYHYPFRSYQH